MPFFSDKKLLFKAGLLFYIQKLYEFVGKSFLIQVFITIGLLPLYAHLGIPVTIFSFIGNIVFLPFLTAVIFLGIILLFCFSFKYIPIHVIYICNKIVFLWLQFMNYFSAHSGGIMIYIPFKGIENYAISWAIFFILYKLKLTNKSLVYMLLYAIIFLCISIYIPKIFFASSKKLLIISCIPQKHRMVCVLYNNNQIYCIEYFRGRNISHKKHAQLHDYVIAPRIAHAWGRSYDHYVIFHDNKVAIKS